MEEQKVSDLGHVGGDAENEKALEEVVQALPSEAVSHLSSLGVSPQSLKTLSSSKCIAHC